MTKDEALKWALEALKSQDEEDVLVAIFDIEHVLAQPEQESVAVMELYTDGWDLVEGIDTDWLETLPFGTKLYTTPPQRTWVELTEGEIETLIHRFDGDPHTLLDEVNARLKEKNT